MEKNIVQDDERRSELEGLLCKQFPAWKMRTINLYRNAGRHFVSFGRSKKRYLLSDIQLEQFEELIVLWVKEHENLNTIR